MEIVFWIYTFFAIRTFVWGVRRRKKDVQNLVAVDWYFFEIYFIPLIMGVFWIAWLPGRGLRYDDSRKISN